MNVGVVGAGVMGLPIAKAYHASGHEVRVFDVREAALTAAESAGLGRANGLGEVAAAADVVAIVVVDDRQVREVATGPGGILASMREEATLVIHSSVLPQTVIDLAPEAESSGVAIVDAPVSGGTLNTSSGPLQVFVGGEEAAASRVLPVLQALGDVKYMGGLGAGEATKLANQMMFFGNVALVYQALQLASAHGIDEDRARDAWQSASGASFSLANLPNFHALFRHHTLTGTPGMLDLMTKDVTNALHAAHEKGVYLPLVSTMAEWLPSEYARRFPELVGLERRD